MVSSHIKFQDPLSNRSWPYASVTDARTYARTDKWTDGQTNGQAQTNMPFFEVVGIKMTAALQLQNCSRRLAHTMYTGKTETFIAVGWCYLFTRISHICPSRNWKSTRNQFGLKCLHTKLLIMWQVSIGNLVKNSNCTEICLTILGTNIKK